MKTQITKPFKYIFKTIEATIGNKHEKNKQLNILIKRTTTKQLQKR